MIAHSYLNSAAQVIGQYQAQEPLAIWLKNFFAADKKFGSRDRKQISHLAYCYYRLNRATQGMDLHEALLLALFLCSDAPQLVLQQLRPKWNELIQSSLEEKLLVTGLQLESKGLFPWLEHLGGNINGDVYAKSLLVQPDLFIRVRPGYYNQVMKKLEQSGLSFQEEDDYAIRLPNGSKIEQLLRINDEVVIQDLRSQDVFKGFMPFRPESSLQVWDCCAASGGKTILFHDLFRGSRIQASDIRASIVANLKKRLQEAGIRTDDVFIADLTQPNEATPQGMDVVICDAPCTGSGTWARTPEQNYFFKEEKIAAYAGVQQSILSKAAQSVRKGGWLIYITCSVFREENEENVKAFVGNHPFSIMDQRYLTGFDEKADTLFAVVFQRL